MATLADMLRQGADRLVELPNDARRFMTNPQAFTQLVTGRNPMPRETGFAAGATGLPAQEMSVLDPNQAPYMQGYSQGEPIGYAGMAAPFTAPAAVATGKALAPKLGQVTENYMVKQGMIQPLTAYHGTPHTIQGQFDINKVGTGEGAQVYGHGMYFAQNPAVAKEYQKSLSGRTDLGQQPSDPAFIHAVESFREAGTPLSVIPAEMKKAYKSATDKDIQLAIQATEKGNLYKVDIPDKDIPMMLDWDKPLLQQTPQVQEALAKLGIKTDKQKLSQFDDALLDALMNDANKPLPKQPINPSGKDIYQTFVQGNPQLTSQKLNEAGIRGIRYLDEGSRSKPYAVAISTKKGPYAESEFATKEQAEQYIKEKQAEGFKTELKNIGTSNFVVFDPKTVKILEQNSKPVTRKELIQEQINKIE
jgi:hypothetical protein